MTSKKDAVGWARADRQRPHHRLNVWQSGKRLVVEVYRATKRFPDDERYGLTAQIRRAAVSVISNIAEGIARESDGDLQRFLFMARGSLNEIDAQLEIAEVLGYLEYFDCRELRSEFDATSRQLQGLINKVRRDLA